MSRGRTGNNQRKAILRSPRASSEQMPVTGEISATRLALLGELTREKHTVLYNLRSFNKPVATTRIKSLLHQSNDPESVIAEMASEKLIEKAVAHECIKCKSAPEAHQSMIIDIDGERQNVPLLCRRCKILGEEFLSLGITPAKTVYKIVEGRAFNTEEDAYQMTAKGRAALDAQHQIKRAKELALLEEELKNGRTNNMKAFEEVISSKLDRQKALQAANSSPSVLWNYALEDKLITKEQWEAAWKEYGTAWNYAGS